jgi:SAM-dependent methyltransferase
MSSVDLDALAPGLPPRWEDRLDRYLFFDRINRPYTAWQLEPFRSRLGRRILEIGCGVGGVIDLLGPRELVYGLDSEPEVLAHAAQRFRDRPECRFACLDFGSIDLEALAGLKSLGFDTVICINVLEHIRDDIGALQKMAEVLEPGGVLALLVPAHLGLYGPYDRLDGHFRRYNKAYLRTILGHTPLVVEWMSYFNAVGGLGWWVQYRLLKRTIHGAGQFGLMNRLIPVLRRVEAVLPPPFGLSLVALCRKGAEPTRP